MKFFALPIVGALLMTAPPGAVAAPSVLSTCGQTVFSAVLAADLDCSATLGFAVVIAPGGTLDLAGYQLTSGDIDISESYPEGGGVHCEGPCSIIGGGGTIVSSVPPTSPLLYGVHADVETPVSISGTTIVGYFWGAFAGSLKIDSSTLSDNLRGSEAWGTLRISNSTIACPNTPDAHESAAAARIRIFDSTIAGGDGIYAENAIIHRSQVTGMDEWGVRAFKRFRAIDSTIDGNCLNTTWEHCADIVKSNRRPYLLNTTCSTSTRFYYFSSEDFGWTTWGVCALD